MNKFLFLLAFLLFLASSCSKKTASPLSFTDPQAIADNKLIIEYIKTKGLKAKHTQSGIYYVIENPGSNEHPTAANTVKCHYTGTLLNGKKFDSSIDRGTPLEFALNHVIKGWTEGIPLLGKGGKGKFIIPSGLAYGTRAMGADIPANSVLVFDVELFDFK